MVWESLRYWAYKYIGQYLIIWKFRKGTRVIVKTGEYGKTIGVLTAIGKSPCGHWGGVVTFDDMPESGMRTNSWYNFCVLERS